MDIPFVIFALYTVVALTIGIIGIIMGIKKIDGAPFITVIAGFMFLIQVILLENIILDYQPTESMTEIQIAVEHYNVNASSSQTAIGGTTIVLGEFVSSTSSLLYLDTIDCITVTMNEALGQTAIGTITIGVFFNDTSTLKKEFGTLDSTLLLNNIRQSFTFCLPIGETYQIQELDNIGVMFNDLTSGIAEVNVFSDGNLFDGTTTYRRGITDTGFSDSTTTDLTAIMYLRGFEIETTTLEPINFAFNTYDTWVFVILLGLIFMFIGVMLQYQK